MVSPVPLSQLVQAVLLPRHSKAYWLAWLWWPQALGCGKEVRNARLSGGGLLGQEEVCDGASQLLATAGSQSLVLGWISASLVVQFEHRGSSQDALSAPHCWYAH